MRQKIAVLALLMLTSAIAGCESRLEEKKFSGSAPVQQMLLVSDVGERLQARPVDPATLTDQPGNGISLDFGHHYSYALSPDGKKMAAVIFPSGEHNRGGVLHLVDLSTWRDDKVEGTSIDDLGQLRFRADGKQLYWAAAATHSLPAAFQLSRYDLAQKRHAKLIDFPPSFIPQDFRLIPGENRLVAYGDFNSYNSQGNDNSMLLQPPHLIFVDLQTEKITADIALDGVKAGQTSIARGEGELAFHYLQPGLAWDLQRKKLYIAHADEDKITAVDLGKAVVEKQAEIRPLRSFGEMASNWLLPRAQAKMIAGTSHRAALSSDGQLLYLSGVRRDLQRDADGNMQYTVTPLGLRIIATDDFSERDRFSLPVDDLLLSPDGKHLLLTGTRLEQHEGNDGALRREGSGIYVFDTVRGEQAAHLEPGRSFYLRGFSLESRYGYVGTISDNGKEAVKSIDLESRRLVGERYSEKGFIDLLPLKRDPNW